MKDKLNIILIGSSKNGQIVCDYLSANKYVNLKLVITYSEKLENNIKYENVIRTPKANNKIDLIKKNEPDYIFVAGWSELLSEKLLAIPSKGTIGFHPAKLPYNKGRSVLAWQIEEGYNETALSMFYYNNFPDGGDIIAQENILINKNDYIENVLEKVYLATYNLMKAYFPLIRQGIAPRIKQDINEGNFRRLRTDIDSKINWNDNAVNIYNKIRAVSKPYPGAFFLYNNEKIRVWKSEVFMHDIKKISENSETGEVVAVLRNDKYIVKCRDVNILITCEEELKIGSILS